VRFCTLIITIIKEDKMKRERYLKIEKILKKNGVTFNDWRSPSDHELKEASKKNWYRKERSQGICLGRSKTGIFRPFSI
jgi:hypothetical protein